jgi:trk system potassium uptake protein TrkA
MKIIIVGCGRVGAQLAEALSSEKHSVVVIDKNKEAFKRLKPTFAGQALEGIGFDKEILLKAGIEKADALAAVTNGDNTNILTAVVAKRMFKVPQVVARIYDHLRAEIYRKMGIPTISTTIWGANKIRDMISHPTIYTEMSFGNGEVELLEVEAPPQLEGRMVKDLSISLECSIFCIVRNSIALIPTLNTPFQKGDKIYMAISPFGKTKLEQMLSL